MLVYILHNISISFLYANGWMDASINRQMSLTVVSIFMYISLTTV